ncbi:MAG: glycosyltransferase family 2 protein [Bacteroidales bacterium]
MTKLSVIIITFNEERNIGRCLQSVKEIADEIIVVDSFSTDETQNICEQFEAKFISEKWRGYSAQKNFANSLASNNWILSIDADEAISEELKNSIKKWKSQGTPQFARFNRLTNYCGQWIKHCGWYPDTKLRIFHKNQAQWSGEVHEKLKFNEPQQIAFLKGDLLHFSYYSIDEHVAQTNKFSSLAAQQLFISGRHIPFIKALLNPPTIFLRKYIINGGFLDGYYGYVICRLAALQTFLKYFKAWQMQKERKKENKS